MPVGPTSGCDMSRFLPNSPVGLAEPLPSAALPLNITGDAFKELLFYNGTTGSWNVQIGTTENSFTQGISGGWSPGWSLFRADFNGNGLDDLLLYHRRLASGTRLSIPVRALPITQGAGSRGSTFPSWTSMETAGQTFSSTIPRRASGSRYQHGRRHPGA